MVIHYTSKQESLLNELLEDFKGDPEAVMDRDGLILTSPLGLCRNSTHQIDFIELIGFSDLASVPM